ncbi:alpha/beta fold hydrolase [Maribacter halichondriae]|uniref:alpha/beta fold hydrolase n=1 Tax=Maribacter halichondriae TaxID=2980554 RepID=UPI0023592A3A|nr:alpha/beta fold hydrolase [Maribacter sp. Hal144]
MSQSFPFLPFKSNFTKVHSFKIHYLDEGAGNPVLFVHGNPTYSYLWRNIIPSVVNRPNTRVIAIDLLGFGFSDKPNIPYTVDLHYSILKEFISILNLKNLTIIAHDWGGPLAVKYSIDHLDNMNKLLVMDTFLWNLTWDDFPKKVKLPFKLMRSAFGYFMIQVMNGFVKSFIPQNIYHKEKITAELMDNYKLPFPTVKSRKAIREFPKMIPVNGKPKSSYDFFEYLENHINKINIPFKMLIAKPGMGEVNMAKVQLLVDIMPNFSFEYIESSGHYMQEDRPDEVVEIILSFINQEHI